MFDNCVNPDAIQEILSMRSQESSYSSMWADAIQKIQGQNAQDALQVGLCQIKNLV